MESVVINALKSRFKLNAEDLEALSIHGVPALTGDLGSGLLDVLVVLKAKKAVRVSRRKILPNSNSIVIIGREELRRDSLEEEYGGVAAHLLLFPYHPLMGGEFLAEVEREYKRHIVLEALRNLVLEHRLASSRVIISPEYFLYEKLRRLSVMYPPARPLIKAVFTGARAEESIKASLEKFEKVLQDLVKEGVLRRVEGGYSPTSRFVEETLSGSTYYFRLSEELEHAFRLYSAAGQVSSLDFLRALEFDFKVLTPPRLPDPNRMLYIRTSLGLQPLRESLGIREFVHRVYGVEGSRVKVRRIGGILNSAWVASFRVGEEEQKIFIKKYLNWTDFKWVVAWLWALGVKNFSVLGSTRMSNEIFFVNKLAEMGFNTAEILHVSWPKRMLFQRFIEGVDGVRALKGGVASISFEEAARAMGRLLAKLHNKGICMGDCNPHSFLFTPDGEIYLIDLEQCSMDGLREWDLAELLYYTAHYFDGDNAERFAAETAKGYLEEGEKEVVAGALNQKYSRLLAPWTPIWIQKRVERGVRNLLESIRA